MGILTSLFTRGFSTKHPSGDKTISSEYAQLNAELHLSRPDYGTSGHQWAKVVAHLVQQVQAESILDYGCGKQTLAKALPQLAITGYDPAMPGLNTIPSPADVVVCTDVLEHVEPEFIENVLDDLARVTAKVALVTVATRPAVKTLADGRNAHLTVQPLSWWRSHFEERFKILAIQETEGYEFALILTSPTLDTAVILPDQFRDKKVAEQTPKTAGKSVASATAVVTHAGVKLHYSTPNDMTAWRVQTLYKKEPHTIQWLEQIPQGAVLLDVGANVGMYSIFAAGVRGAMVYAFEPESQNFALLNANIALNSFSERILAFPVALSDTVGLDKLYLSQFSAGGSCHSIGEEVGFDLKPRKSPFIQGSVCTTIDQLVADGKMPVPDYIKVDVDGFEHKVFAGASKTLQDLRVKGIIVELNTHLAEHRAVVDALVEAGFKYDESQVNAALRQEGAFKGVGEFIFSREVSKSSFDFSRTHQVTLPTTARAQAVMRHVLQRIENTQVKTHPFPYLVVDDLFPADYYEEILSHLPDESSMKPLGESGRVARDAYRERLALLFEHDEFERMPERQRVFWRELSSWLYSNYFLSQLIARFYDVLAPRMAKILDAENELLIKGDSLIVNDQTNYAIGPHTDAPHRLITLLFYLPQDRSMSELGTSIYVPKDRAFTDWGGPHHKHEKFDLVETVDYVPNRLLMFPKTEKSFHGVEKIERPDVKRHLLINNIRLLNKVTH